MIAYETGGVRLLLQNCCRINGSVFPKALIYSIPSCVLTAVFVQFVWNPPNSSFQPLVDAFAQEDSVMTNNAIWGGFSFLVGFLVVFRTSQAYNRFWEGVTHTHKMGAEWFDACSALMAFTRHSTAPAEKIMRFHNTLVRLFSMLHASALGEIEESGEHQHYSDVAAFNMELIDAESMCDECLMYIRDCDFKVELIFQWIQMLIVENIKTEVLSIPPPILSRSFQEIATGMVHFHEALKISNVPFPFPYAQTCDTLLLLHWIIVPFVVSQWVTKPLWAAIFCFIQVFTLWTLNLIACELENPFGTDPNDIDGAGMQMDLNNSLRLLLRASLMATPGLKTDAGDQIAIVKAAIGYKETAPKYSSFVTCWRLCQEKSGDNDKPTKVARRATAMGASNRQSTFFSSEASVATKSQRGKALTAALRFGNAIDGLFGRALTPTFENNDSPPPRRSAYFRKERLDQHLKQHFEEAYSRSKSRSSVNSEAQEEKPGNRCPVGNAVQSSIAPIPEERQGETTQNRTADGLDRAGFVLKDAGAHRKKNWELCPVDSSVLDNDIGPGVLSKDIDSFAPIVTHEETVIKSDIPVTECTEEMVQERLGQIFTTLELDVNDVNALSDVQTGYQAPDSPRDVKRPVCM